jgi:hypothetical protein
MADRPKNIPSEPSKQGDAPHPDQIPKLPQTIFNLEKGSSASRESKAPR